MPTWYLIRGLKVGLNFNNFLQFQEEFGACLINQKHLSLSRTALTQAFQWLPDSLNKSHICLEILALIQILRSFEPSPPSVLGWQTFFHLTFAPKAKSSIPFQRKEQHNLSTTWLSFWKQKHWKLVVDHVIKNKINKLKSASKRTKLSSPKFDFGCKFVN